MREITKRFVEHFDKRSPFKIQTAHNRKKERNPQRNGGEEKRLSLGAAARCSAIAPPRGCPSREAASAHLWRCNAYRLHGQ